MKAHNGQTRNDAPRDRRADRRFRESIGGRLRGDLGEVDQMPVPDEFTDLLTLASKRAKR